MGVCTEASGYVGEIIQGCMFAMHAFCVNNSKQKQNCIHIVKMERPASACALIRWMTCTGNQMIEVSHNAYHNNYYDNNGCVLYIIM